VGFRELAGHAHLLELIAAAARRGTLPPSLIFDGPGGVGKRTAAVALAQAINCLQPAPFAGLDGADACGACSSCKRIARGVHADVLLIEPGDTGTIKVDQVREAIDRAAYRPFEGRRRVVIVDDADERTLANADLKAELSRLLKSFDGERTLGAFAAVERALAALDRNASPKIVADWLALNL
jgi:DNA polymerase-3 subunit delta'